MQLFDIYIYILHIFIFRFVAKHVFLSDSCSYQFAILYFGAGTTWSPCQAVGSDLTLLVQHQEPVAEDTPKNGLALIQRELELIFMIFFI